MIHSDRLRTRWAPGLPCGRYGKPGLTQRRQTAGGRKQVGTSGWTIPLLTKATASAFLFLSTTTLFAAADHAQQPQCDAKTGSCPDAASAMHKYCVVGAGPAGIQMGHLLNKAGRDYVVFERGPRAGTFFNK